jgi:hypothetical protein
MVAGLKQSGLRYSRSDLVSINGDRNLVNRPPPWRRPECAQRFRLRSYSGFGVRFSRDWGRLGARLLGIALTLVASAVEPEDSGVGQWVWSRRDIPVLDRVRQTRPETATAVLIAELAWDGQVRVRLRLSPQVVPMPDQLVVRLDDSFHHAPADVGAALDRALARLLSMTGPALVHTPVEIDYDAPVSRLSLYADWLRELRADALRGRAVWITTLIAHLRDPDFEARFAGLVDGHVVQVFDTGEPWTPDRSRSLLERLAGIPIPFALGLGAFDREGTDHAAWLRVLPELRTLPTYRGVWVFAAGFDWSPMSRSLP